MGGGAIVLAIHTAIKGELVNERYHYSYLRASEEPWAFGAFIVFLIILGITFIVVGFMEGKDDA